MKSTVQLLAITLLAVIIMPSCKKKSAGGPLGLIPKESSVVLTVNAGRLMDKLAKDGISTDRFEEVIMGGDSVVKPAGVFWSGAKETGIDFSKPLYVAVGIPSSVQSRHAPVRIIASIADAEALDKMLKKRKEVEVVKEKGITYAILEESVLGHDGKTAVYVGGMDADKLTGVDTRGSGFNNDNEAGDFNADSARKEIARSFGLSRSESIASVASFEEMPVGDNDMRIWMNNESGTPPMMQDDMFAATMLMEKLLKGGSNVALINFENGRMTMKSRMYFNKAAADTIKLSPPRSLDLSLLDRFPGNRLNFFIGLAVEPQMINHLMKFTGLDGLAVPMLVFAGLKMDDITNAIGGDLMLVVSDFNIAGSKALIDLSNEEGGSEMGPLLNNAKVALLARVKDKTLLEKILASPKVAEKLTREGDYYTMTDNGQKLYISVGEKTLIASASRQLIDEYNAGTAKNSFDAATLARMKDKSVGFYMSMASLMDGMPQELKEAGMQQGSASIASFFREAYMTGGHFTNNYFETEGAFVMGDANRNSLATLVRKGAGLAMMFMNSGMRRDMGEDDNAAGMDDRLQPMDIKPVETSPEK